MKHWPGSAPSTTPSTATGGVARSIDWSRSSTPAGPRVAAADHLRRPGFTPDLREGHPVSGRRVRRSAATPVRSVSTPAPSALTGALRTGTITFGMWARTTAGSGKSPARWPASVPLRSISYAPMASRTSAKLSISTPSTSYHRPQLRQATRARILMTRTEWPWAQGCDGGSRDPTEWHGAEDRAEADGQDRQAWRQTAQNWSLMQLVIDEERVIKVDGVALQGLRGLHRPGSGAAPACRAHPPGALAHARRADHPRADAGWGCRPLWA